LEDCTFLKAPRGSGRLKLDVHFHRGEKHQSTQDSIYKSSQGFKGSRSWLVLALFEKKSREINEVFFFFKENGKLAFLNVFLCLARNILDHFK
jgi:hypothetical protein